MKRIRMTIIAAALVAAIALPVLALKGCGSDWTPDNLAPVTIRLVSAAGELADETPVQLPPGVRYIEFRVTAEGMVPVVRVTDTGGYGPVSESFNIVPGPARVFSVKALDDSGAVLWEGSAQADIGIEPARVSVIMEFLLAGDTLPPDIPGDIAITLAAANTVGISWDEPYDDHSVAGYYVYEMINGVPYLSYSVTNTWTEITVEGPGYYCYQVSAIDSAGNESVRSADICIEVGGSGTDPRDPGCPEFLTYIENPGGNYKWHPDSNPPKCYGETPPPRTWWKRGPGQG